MSKVILIDKVLKTILLNRIIEAGDTVLVAVSGGPDSVCLLHVLHSLSGNLDLKLHAVHINHGLRGEESNGDELYTRELCKDLGIPLHVKFFDIFKISKDKGMSLEEAGREVRYSEFYKIADGIGANRIAVAHNRNDQAETILLNMIRGTGLSGLCGMDHQRGRVIRPLLDIPRDEIEAYCVENQLSPRIDSSNLKGDFTRNKVRLDLIPHINENFGGNFTENLYRMSQLLRNDYDFLEKEANKAYEECSLEPDNNSVKLDLDKLSNLHPAITGRVIRIAVRKVKGDLKGLESKHVEDVAALATKRRTGTSIQLPKGIRAEISYNQLIIFSDNFRKPKVYFDRQLSIPGFTEIDELQISITASIVDKAMKVDKCDNMGYNSLVQFFDYDRLYMGINIRNRSDGDVFSPLGFKGTKKLKEYFIDCKIPRCERDAIPLVTCGKDVIWIIGYRISDKFKVTDNTKSIIKMEVMRRPNV